MIARRRIGPDAVVLLALCAIPVLCLTWPAVALYSRLRRKPRSWLEEQREARRLSVTLGDGRPTRKERAA